MPQLNKIWIIVDVIKDTGKDDIHHVISGVGFKDLDEAKKYCEDLNISFENTNCQPFPIFF